MENTELSLPTPSVPAPTALAAPPSEAPAAGLHAGGPSEDPFGERSRASTRLGNVRKRIGSVIAAVVALLAKFGAGLKVAVVALAHAKLFLTAGTALVSVVLYSLVFGWWFAVGFVVLLFVHEMGHVIQLRREGIRATAPVFIPFLGAVVGMKEMPDDALAEARVGLAGPILGTAGAAVCFALAEATGSSMLRALAYVGFLINLINLVPLTPFDGGRAMAAMVPALWFVGLGLTLFLALETHIAILWIFVLFGGWDTYRRWKLRKAGSVQQAAYYRVSPRDRVLVGLVYVGLIAVLAAGMVHSEVLQYAGHTFHLR
jgi:Zn-dependent protease